MSAVPSLLDFDSREHRRSMTSTEVETFVAASHDRFDRDAMLLDAKRAFDGDMGDNFELNVFCMRLADRAAATRVTPGVVLFVMCQCKNPAMVVMWAYTLHRLSQRVGLVTMEQFARAFPFGIPTEASYRACWQAQKRVITPGMLGDNQLDRAEAWAEPPLEEALKGMDRAITDLRAAASKLASPPNATTPVKRRIDLTE